ncbi:hypothetical protein V1508DRAFT_413962 [Lipomyces doorenjongii]|uniref:uncharacterized protein n=1 Tax=Lipomyces doorenjongii TaxID=383834 RepID=UPI0034CDCEFB
MKMGDKSISQTFGGTFWSNDYYSGLNLLHGKQVQGFYENSQILQLMDHLRNAEESYGRQLEDAARELAPSANGFGRDEGASLRKAYEAIVKQVVKKGSAHIDIARGIQAMAINPFAEFAIQHERKVRESVKHATGMVDTVKKLQREVQNSARTVETKRSNLERYKRDEPISSQAENPKKDELTSQSAMRPGAVYTDENRPPAQSTPLDRAATNGSLASKDDDDIDEESFFTIAGIEYSRDQLGHLLSVMLDKIPQSDHKVAILGTYHDTSLGADIVEWIRSNTRATTTALAEEFGQDLLEYGFIRLVGNIGNTFVNSSRMRYQWRKKAFMLAGKVSPKAAKEGVLGESLLGLYNAATGVNSDESPIERLERELQTADEKYKAAIKQLDTTRCYLEETLISHFKNMERYDFERIESVKRYLNVFSACMANSIPRMQAIVDEIELYHETIMPRNDVKFMIASYQTGYFVPQTDVYRAEFMRNNLQQMFGVDFITRLEEEQRDIPYIVPTILRHLEDVYPTLENDSVRGDVWLRHVALSELHKLRSEINAGKAFAPEILTRYQPHVVASALKLYFLELPDSLVEGRLYDAIKDYYGHRRGDIDLATYQNNREFLLPLTNILEKLNEKKLKTLITLTLHFQRLVNVLRLGPQFEVELAQEMSRLLLRPRVQSPVTMGDLHGQRFVLDLIRNGVIIFRTLKANLKVKRGDSLNEPEQRPKVVDIAGSLRDRVGSPALPGDSGVDSPNINHGQPTLNIVLTPASRRRHSSASMNPAQADDAQALGDDPGSIAAGSPRRRNESQHSLGSMPTIVVPNLSTLYNNHDPVETGSHGITESKDYADLPERTTSLGHIRGRSLVGEVDANADNENTVTDGADDTAARFQGIQLIDPPMADDF